MIFKLATNHGLSSRHDRAEHMHLCYGGCFDRAWERTTYSLPDVVRTAWSAMCLLSLSLVTGEFQAINYLSLKFRCSH